MEQTLSIPLLNKIKDSIREKRDLTIDWHYRDELSVEQINKILSLPNGMDEVISQISENCMDLISQTELDLLRGIIEENIEEICEELNWNRDTIGERSMVDLVEQYSLRDQLGRINFNIEQLISNTRPAVVLQLELYHEFQGWQWKSNVQYADVREALKLFNINPRKVHHSFPNLAYRNGNEFILPKDLKELWDNACYGGQYVMPINLDLSDFNKNRDHYHTAIKLHKGSEIWMHDYLNGSGSISIPLLKDMVIVKRKVGYHFGDDNDTAGYGLNQVYGLTKEAWDNDISPVITPHPVPHELPPYQDVVKHFMYGNVVADWQTSTIIRPYHDYRPRWNNEIPLSGEMMQWDIDHGIWNNFPTSGKKYLQDAADKNAYHCVFKIREIIGQVVVIHCQFIVNDQSGEIVWSRVTDSDRSYHIFNFLKGKIKPKKLP